MNKEDKNTFDDFFSRNDYGQDQSVNELLYKYLEILIDTNNKFNLTSYSSFSNLLEKHVRDSLEVLKIDKINEKKCIKLIDIGSGCGFPAIPIGIFKKDWNITLVESIGKKANFLQNVINELKLSNINLIHDRSEQIARKSEFNEKFDIVTARGLAKGKILIDFLSPFIKQDGLFALWKSMSEIVELRKRIKIFRIIEIYEYKSCDTNRYIAIMKRRN
jgi:16S rRNA (guanine527-N7)-methyltransferase